MSFETPVLCLLLETIGGRGEVRLQSDSPSEGEYFGPEHLSFIAPRTQAFLFSSSLGHATFACFCLRAQEADCLLPDQVAFLERSPTRLMFRDDRLHTCARMLGTYEGGDEHEAYGRGLRQALWAALIGAVGAPATGSEPKLSGLQVDGVLTYILDHLQHRVTNEELAQVAGWSPSEFGRAFRLATGVTPQRWQMDARVRLAQRLMVEEPTLSLATIAVRSGFVDQSHFSRAFLDILGATPTAWLHQRR